MRVKHTKYFSPSMLPRFLATACTLIVAAGVLFLLTGAFPGVSTVGLAAPDQPDGNDNSNIFLRIESAWARPAIRGGNGAVYFTITNDGDENITLIGATAEVAHVVEIHETVFMTKEEAAALGGDHDGHDDHADHHHAGDAPSGDGVFVMLHLPQLVIKAGQTIAFQPAGHHIMLIDLVETLAWDTTFPLTLHFDDGNTITIQVSVGDEPRP